MEQILMHDLGKYFKFGQVSETAMNLCIADGQN